MTAPSGGGRPGDGARSPMSSVLERPEAAQGGARPEPRPRPLGEIFPQGGSANRGRELQGTWRAFCQDMAGAVQARARSRPLAAGDRLCDRRTRAQLFPHARRHAHQLRTAPPGGRASRPSTARAKAGRGAGVVRRRAGEGALAGRRAAACAGASRARSRLRGAAVAAGQRTAARRGGLRSPAGARARTGAGSPELMAARRGRAGDRRGRSTMRSASAPNRCRRKRASGWRRWR